MFDLAPHLLARPLVGWWLTTSPESWRRVVVAADSPHVHARGTNPDRVLVAGDGAATGRGVVSHDLGLPGHLARALTVHTGRATDVDIVVRADMTAESCLPALADIELSQFDIVVLTLGANEALALTATERWRASLSTLVADLQGRAPAATQVFLLPIPFFGGNPAFPRWLGRVVDRHVQRLNAATEALVAELDGVSVVPVDQSSAYEAEGAHVYRRWAEGIALRISAALDPSRLQAGSTERADEESRQQALEALERLAGVREAEDLEDAGAPDGSTVDAELERLTEEARQVFGTPIAAVTLIHSDVQVMKAAVGIDPVVLPREESFCDVTIRRASHLVIEDASLDPRYSDFSIVEGEPGVRFYAGYPIESPDGHRVGALCLMDTQPRSFTDAEAGLLRSLALRIQEHLWRGPAAG
jgi:hypothetical protein